MVFKLSSRSALTVPLLTLLLSSFILSNGYFTNNIAFAQFNAQPTNPPPAASSTSPPPLSTTGSPVSISVQTDKPSYVVGEGVIVSGNVSPYSQGQKIRLDVYDPKGDVFASDVTLDVQRDGSFATHHNCTMFQCFYSLAVSPSTVTNYGPYTALVTYNGESVQTTFNVSATYSQPQFPTSNISPSTTGSPVSISVQTDKPSYVVGEGVIVSGNVSPYSQGQKIRLDVYDPKGDVFASDVTLDVQRDGSFATHHNCTMFQCFYSLAVSPSTVTNYGPYTALVTYNGESVQTTFNVTPKL